MFKKLLLLLLFTTLFSCKSNEENDVSTTYISGQIINPTCDYIIFSRGYELRDTVNLDSNNFFHYKTDKITAGLYALRHNETQVFYIEPGDSLLLHLNTIDFDESLAYSGKGAEQNNLLMDLFLKNQTENQNLPRWYTLSSSDFESKIDSLRALKVSEYEDFIKNNEVAEDFKKVALASINYDYYSKKEMYAAANMRIVNKIDPSFFAYRNEVNFQWDELKFYYPYYRFMNRYFDNMVFSEYDHKTVVDRNSFKYNYRRIQLIDSTVKSAEIKNNLLYTNAWWYMQNAKDADQEKRFYKIFSKINSDERQVEELGKLLDISIKLTAGKTMPNIALVNTDNVVKDLKSIIKAPTVIYFWTAKFSAQSKNLHNRAAELKSKYPEYNFIGINVDTHFKNWREIVKKRGYNPDEEFQLENITEAEKNLMLKSMNKTIILDENGVILDGKTNLFHINFEELLLGFLNR
ncbi:TlpA family protein disulfide reductase [Aequorivita capsosiphonis]|uniref:TlpA family protein disulfide reductase n=1 Tax=Aequorivita capsosiphonis TaxID=487317 RepID=UPI0012F7B70E|nr:thioredoxin-like domain-containing protein [Aequorivita capsosiphonis]